MRSRRVLGITAAAGAAAMVAAGVLSAATSPTATLRVSVTGAGKVTSSPKGISCPKACVKKFAKGKAVKLTARPASTSLFKRWTGACAAVKKRVCTVKLKAAKRAGAVFALRPKPPAGFTPQTLAGTWAGTWNDQRFGTSGTIGVVVTVVNPTTFTITLTLGGPVAGCTQPQAPLSATITPGTGMNLWNEEGFEAQATDPQGGSAILLFDFDTKRLTGNGSPGCRPGLKWTLAATQDGNTISGRLDATLEDGSPVPTVFTVTRS